MSQARGREQRRRSESPSLSRPIRTVPLRSASLVLARETADGYGAFRARRGTDSAIRDSVRAGHPELFRERRESETGSSQVLPVPSAASEADNSPTEVQPLFTGRMRSSEARVSTQEVQSGLRDPSVYVAGTTEEEQGWSVFSGSSRGLPRASSRRVRSKEASPVRTVGEIRSGLPDLGRARRDTSGESDRGTVQSAEAAPSGERGSLGKSPPKSFGVAPQKVKAPKSTGETDSLRANF